MKSRSFLLAFFQVLLFFLKLSFAETITYQQGANGYAGFEDTYIVMSTDSTSDNAPLLIVEGYHCSACIDERALFHFDLSSFDTANKVTKAELQLYSPSQPRPGPGTIRAYKVSRHWTAADANWFNAASGAKWSAVGGDFSATEVGSLNYGPQLNVWHTLDVTKAVKDFINDPTSNFGLLVMLDPSMLTVAYVSSEGTKVEQRPKLIITFSNTGVISGGLSKNHTPQFAITRVKSGLDFSFPFSGFHQLLVSRLDGKTVFNDRVSGPSFFLNTALWATGSYGIISQGSLAAEHRSIFIFK